MPSIRQFFRTELHDRAYRVAQEMMNRGDCEVIHIPPFRFLFRNGFWEESFVEIEFEEMLDNIAGVRLDNRAEIMREERTTITCWLKNNFRYSIKKVKVEPVIQLPTISRSQVSDRLFSTKEELRRANRSKATR